MNHLLLKKNMNHLVPDAVLTFLRWESIQAIHHSMEKNLVWQRESQNMVQIVMVTPAIWEAKGSINE